MWRVQVVIKTWRWHHEKTDERLLRAAEDVEMGRREVEAGREEVEARQEEVEAKATKIREALQRIREMVGEEATNAASDSPVLQ